MNSGTFVTAAVLLICALALFSGGAIAEVAGDDHNMSGEGVADDPYVITTVEELQAIDRDLDAHYVIGTEIDASRTEAWNAGDGFEPIGSSTDDSSFTGNLDGRGHEISNVFIRTTGDNVGLFSEIDGTVSNLSVEGARVRSTGDQVGILVGRTEGSILNVYTSGRVEGAERVGGLAGHVSDEGTVERTGSDATVFADELAGGLVGLSRTEHSITESYATGEIHGGEIVGGLVGGVRSDSEVRLVYTTADIKRADGDNAGSLVGGIGGAGGPGTVSDTYATGTNPRGAGIVPFVQRPPVASHFDTETVNSTAAPDVGKALGTAEMTGADAEEYMDLDFENYWTVTDGYPVLRWQVEDVDLQVPRSSLGEGETTPVTVELALDDGSTVTATEVAEYDAEEAVAGVADGRLEAHSVGETELVATVAGERDSVTVEVLEPPEIELVDADLGAETAVEGTPLELELTHENAGGPGSETVEVSVGDDRVVHSTVRLDGGETATERLRWNAEDSGPVTVAGADEPLGELTVVEPDVLALESIALPEEVPRDEPYGIDLEFDNELDRAVSERVELRVDGEEVTEEVVVVGAGGSTETITYDHDAVGTATHVVDRGVEVETGTVEILEPAKLAVDELAVPEAVNEGERGTVTATVTNVGGADGDGELVLSVDGEAAGSESISLEPGETDRIAFEASFDEHGAATVTVESPDDRRETSVTVDAPEETGEEDDGAADVGGDGDEGETTDAGNEADDAADETDGFGAAVALVAVLLALVTHTAVRRAAPSATSR